MSYLDWKVGDRVVCVDASFPAGRQPLVEGKVYQIRRLHPCQIYGNLGILLDGVHNGRHPETGNELGYLISRFRKVQPRKTDISVFTAMLNKTGVDA